VTHGTTSSQALAWQKLLVSQGVFADNPDNCDSSYTGPRQQEAVMTERERLGLDAADGLLDQEFYDCLVDGCGNGCREVEIPDVTGRSRSDAEEELRRTGFSVTTEEEESATDPEGTVIGQDPDPGDLGCEGDTVTITVAAGTTRTPAPAPAQQ
jgi:hypothetical protein